MTGCFGADVSLWYERLPPRGSGSSAIGGSTDGQRTWSRGPFVTSSCRSSAHGITGSQTSLFRVELRWASIVEFTETVTAETWADQSENPCASNALH
jgi:hypothetical protein